ncbi:MAG TPA: peptidoglycan recognition family protein [Bacteriovoracaceae bacterium]|nr:peptidoglycan recognition family protein [Bacteriovoracaceae bacterium]
MRLLKLAILLCLNALPLPGHGQDCVDCSTEKLQLSIPRPDLPPWPLELIPIKNVVYDRNLEVSYCKRPVEMVDSIVLHHSASSDLSTSEELNDHHIEKNNWHMLGYSYVIHSPYQGGPGSTTVSAGRPLEMVGAHAGSTAFVKMNPGQSKLWESGRLVCGIEGSQFKVTPSELMNNQNIKANATTIGVVVVGNYSPFSRTNSTGYSPKYPRRPTGQTIDAIARLSCQLQKKYPLIQNIKWHNFYKDAKNGTACPGNIKNFIGDIKLKAKDFGCVFK